MLNPFPDLLVFSFFGPTLIRVAVALAFFYIAYGQSMRRHEIAQMEFPVVGRSARITALSAAFFVLVGGMLFLGYHTQVAAILALLGLIKCLVLTKWYPRLMPIDRTALVLLIVMCLSLLISGAGAYAFDLPL
ncbi:hypothetical protein EXS62_00980 [Candidatus Kaiserbacteria bacterium]|nr:hypothetical protein [Candidatus Kaiserbacteria bacterium]